MGPHRKVVYSLSMSVDGYIVGPDGAFDWSPPDRTLFDLATEEVKGLGVHIMGRRLYETMLFWESADQEASLDYPTDEFARVWRALPKVVFSRTLDDVRGNARLSSAGLDEEINRFRVQPGDGDIGIGGATLAAEAAALDLIDEYRMRVLPVRVGGGIPFFARDGRMSRLELQECRTISSQTVYLRYLVLR